MPLDEVLMPKRWGLCAEVGCPVLCDSTYCPAHAPMHWNTSTRRHRLPPGWGRLRRQVLRRDGGICQTCGDVATEVDHIVPGDNHDPSNLAAICTPCHRAKSSREGNAALNAKRRSMP